MFVIDKPLRIVIGFLNTAEFPFNLLENIRIVFQLTIKVRLAANFARAILDIKSALENLLLLFSEILEKDTKKSKRNYQAVELVSSLLLSISSKDYSLVIDTNALTLLQQLIIDLYDSFYPRKNFISLLCTVDVITKILVEFFIDYDEIDLSFLCCVLEETLKCVLCEEVPYIKERIDLFNELFLQICNRANEIPKKLIFSIIIALLSAENRLLKVFIILILSIVIF